MGDRHGRRRDAASGGRARRAWTWRSWTAAPLVPTWDAREDPTAAPSGPAAAPRPGPGGLANTDRVSPAGDRSRGAGAPELAREAGRCRGCPITQPRSSCL